jgi:hypothetical protein
MGFFKDLEKEFNKSNNNTTEKYENNELFTEQTKKTIKEDFSMKFDKRYKWYDTLAIMLGGLPVQLYYRIKYFRGSLDNLWLLIPIFYIPPFTVIPLYYIFRNKFIQGKDDLTISKMFNKNYFNKISSKKIKKMLSYLFIIIAPIVGAIFGPTSIILEYLVTLIFVFICFLLKDFNRCISDVKIIDNIKKILFSSTNTLSVYIVILTLTKFLLSNIEFIKNLYNTEIPIFSVIMNIIFLFASTLGVDMFNNTPFHEKKNNNIDFKYCSSRNWKKLGISGGVYVIIVLVAALINMLIQAKDEGEGE